MVCPRKVPFLLYGPYALIKMDVLFLDLKSFIILLPVADSVWQPIYIKSWQWLFLIINDFFLSTNSDTNILLLVQYIGNLWSQNNKDKNFNIMNWILNPLIKST